MRDADVLKIGKKVPTLLEKIREINMLFNDAEAQSYDENQNLSAHEHSFIVWNNY